MRQTFSTLNVVKLEVQDGWPDLPNLVRNPSGQGGAWEWTTTGNLDAIAGPALNLTGFNADNNSPLAQYRAAITAGAGQSVRASITPTAWVNAAGTDATVYIWAVVPSGTTPVASATFDETALGNPVEIATTAIPSDATALILFFSSSDSPGLPGTGSYFTFKDVWMICGPTADVTASDPLTEPTWTDITGPTYELKTSRTELDTGTLTANIADVALDPSVSGLIRRGKRVRLTARVAGAWEPLFTGRVATGKVTYEVKDPKVPERKRARIELVATDNANLLAGTAGLQGVATIDELPAVLLGGPVAWRVNGSTEAIDPSTAVIVAENESASMLDQVAITRDTAQGYAWIDRGGVLQAWDADQIPTTIVRELSEADYSDIDIDFDSERAVNSVTVTVNQINSGTGETEEVSFGPYVDANSVREWGTLAATYTVQGVTDPAAFAASVLAANATPELRITGAQIPIRNLAEITANATLDLYDLVSTSNIRASVDEDQRIVTVEHSITPTRWTLNLSFAGESRVAQPQVTPSPGVASGGKTIVQLLRPVGEMTMWFGAKADIPAGWLPCDGSTFSADTYPDLAELLGGTVLPNMTDRFPVGAGTKSLASSGGSPTVVLTDVNLPPHAHNMDHDHTISTRTEGVVGTNTSRVAASSGTGATDDDNTAPNAYAGSTGNGPGTSTPVDVLNPWRAVWFVIRAA